MTFFFLLYPLSSYLFLHLNYLSTKFKYLSMSIDAVLSEIVAYNNVFSIEFVRASGKQQGQIKIVMRAKYGAYRKEEEKIHRKSTNTNTDDNLHKFLNTIPMHDLDKVNEPSKGYFTPKISHIITFNGKTVIH